MFTDESPIDLYPEPNSNNYRYRTDSIANVPTIAVPKHGLRIMVAAGITGFRKTELIVIDEDRTANADYYAAKILPVYLWSRYEKDIFPDLQF